MSYGCTAFWSVEAQKDVSIFANNPAVAALKYRNVGVIPWSDVGNRKNTPLGKMIAGMQSPIVVFNTMGLFLTFQLDFFLYLHSDTRTLLL